MVHLSANHERGWHGVKSLLQHSTDYTVSVHLAPHGRTIQLKTIANASDRVTLKGREGEEKMHIIFLFKVVYA